MQQTVLMQLKTQSCRMPFASGDFQKQTYLPQTRTTGIKYFVPEGVLAQASTDMLLISWILGLMHAFVPIPTIPRVLRKLRQDAGLIVTVIQLLKSICLVYQKED